MIEAFVDFCVLALFTGSVAVIAALAVGA